MNTSNQRVHSAIRARGAAVAGALAATLLGGCSTQPTTPDRVGPANAPCDDLTERTVIPAEERVVPRYASRFTVTYEKGHKRINIVDPWRGAKFDLSFVLVPCGEELPAVDADTTVLRFPPRRVVTTSTTQLPHFIALDLIERLAGHNRFDYVSSPEIRARIDAGALVEVGDGVRLNAEILIDLQPDLVLATSIGNPELDVLGMLRGLAIPFALDSAFIEPTPLGRAEWIKFTALFFDKEAEANRLFDGIEARYQELAQLGRSAVKRPTVLVGTPFQGTWHVSGGAAYQARLIADAGGDYLWADDPSSGAIPLDFETVYARGLNADVWIHPYGWSSLGEGLGVDSRMGDFAAFKSGQVFNNDKRVNNLNGNDYWETGSLRPDLILADLLHIFHPELLPDHELLFHRRLPR